MFYKLAVPADTKSLLV